MSSEPDKQDSQTANHESNQLRDKSQLNELKTDDLLKTRIDSDTVVDFIENMVHAIGSTASENIAKPQHNHKRSPEPLRKHQSKSVATIMQKLDRLKKYPDLAAEIAQDTDVTEWLKKESCKQKEYYEELKCAKELTSLFAGYRQFDLAVKAANKAVAITILHKRDDEETLSELNWVLAELYAAANNMDVALTYMLKCLQFMEPGACEGHQSYCDLLSQLEETRQRSNLTSAT